MQFLGDMAPSDSMLAASIQIAISPDTKWSEPGDDALVDNRRSVAPGR